MYARVSYSWPKHRREKALAGKAQRQALAGAAAGRRMASNDNTPHSKKAYVSAGLGHSAVVCEGGDLMAWGLSRQCQLGVDKLTEKDRKKGKTEADLAAPEDRHTPEVVATLKSSGDKVTSVACGSSHTLAVTGAGNVFSWGSGAFGKLGHDDDMDVRIPRLVEFKRKRISRVSCGPEHSAVVSEAGEVRTWGACSYGNLGHGDNTDQPRPKLVDHLVGKRCTSVACGSKHTLSLSQAGDVYAWGYGGGGRLGCGDNRGLFRPKLIETIQVALTLTLTPTLTHTQTLTLTPNPSLNPNPKPQP